MCSQLKNTVTIFSEVSVIDMLPLGLTHILSLKLLFLNKKEYSHFKIFSDAGFVEGPCLYSFLASAYCANMESIGRKDSFP